MENIKKSFKKTFLPTAVAAAILMIITASLSVLGNFGSLLDTILKAPLYIGFYSFLFKRMGDESHEIPSIFDFYKSGGKWWKSYWMVNLGALILAVLLIMVIIGGAAALASSGSVEEAVIFLVIVAVLLLAGLELFGVMPYLYAKDNNIGIGDAIIKSFKLGAKYMFVFLAIDIIIGGVRLAFIIGSTGISSLDEFLAYANEVGKTLNVNQSGSVVIAVVDWLSSAFMIWANFTAVYIIFERENIYDENSRLYDNEEKNYKHNYDYFERSDDGEEPFIEPYNFFIEADERFSDEKVIETEDIRGIDILSVLDEMELTDDIKVNFVIRRKLKKMFGELSFEIGEYNTYNGRRSIENNFIEEIDDRKFLVSVKISKSSDYEPFVLTIKISLEED